MFFSNPKKIIAKIQEISGCELIEVENILTENGYCINKRGKIIGINLAGKRPQNLQFLHLVPNLEFLDLSNNQLFYIEPIKNLKKLVYLNLKNNKILDLTPIGFCLKLRALNLSWNYLIYDLKPIKNLREIEFLNLERNHVIDLKPIAQFRKLTYLNLLGNSLKKAETLSLFVNLKEINVGHNRIENLEWFVPLTKVEKLIANRNQIEEIPDLGAHDKLEKINLSKNYISQVSISKTLNQLNHIYLDQNNLNDIDFINKAPNIQILTLRNNNIPDFKALKNKRGLTHIDIRENPISELEPWICNNTFLDIYWNEHEEIAKKSRKGFYFFNNPLTSPPSYIVESGKEAVQNWFEASGAGDIENTHSKLIISGNSRVGKTTLIEYFINQTFESSKDSTHGISLLTWTPANTNIVASIWDFGGQEYYHATHRLFFTRDVVYLLLWDQASNNDESILQNVPINSESGIIKKNITELQNHNYRYWLSLIRQYAGSSKIIMVQTKADSDNMETIPETCFIKNRTMMQPEERTFFISTKNAFKYQKEQDISCKMFYDEVNELKEKIKKDLISSVFPKRIPSTWNKIRDDVLTLKKSKPYIDLNEFIKICDNTDTSLTNDILDPNSQFHTILLFLYRSGVVLYYKDNIFLKDVLFLDPVYITETIYSILSLKVKENEGMFTEEHVFNILKDRKRATMFIELMKAPMFELIFQMPGEADTYVAPQYLPDLPPIKKVEYRMLVDPLTTTVFVFRFQDTQLSNIMLRLLAYYGENALYKIYWKNGILISKDDTKVFIEGSVLNKTISIRTEDTAAYSKVIRDVYNRLLTLCEKNIEHEFSYDGENFLTLDYWFNLVKNRARTHEISNKQIEIKLDYFYFLNNMAIYSETISQDEIDVLYEKMNKLIERNNKLRNKYKNEKIPANRYALGNEIREIENEIKGLSATISELGDLPNSSNKIHYTLENIAASIDKTQIDIGEMKREMNLQTDILKHFSKNTLIISQYLINLNQSQQLFVKEILGTINDTEINTNNSSSELSINIVDSVISDLKERKIPHKEEIITLINNEITSANKLKLTIPIIPLILSYEKEIGLESAFNLKSWKDLKKLFSRKKL